MAAEKCGAELYLRPTEIMQVLALCTANEMAVLGVEIFEVRLERLFSKLFSTYETYDPNIRGRCPQHKAEWIDYVNANNNCAEKFLRENTIANEDVCILTTASWREFCELRN